MKPDSQTLELYTAGSARTEANQSALVGVRSVPHSPPWTGFTVLKGWPARSLFGSLLIHGVLLFACLAGSQLLAAKQTAPSVMPVFLLQQPGEPRAPEAARFKSAPPVARKESAVRAKRASETEGGPEPDAPLFSSSPADSYPGLAMASGPPIHATDQHGSGSGSAAATGKPPAKSDEGQTIAEVLAHPLYASNPPPPYPRLARKLGHQGLVQLEVLVSVAGRVDDLRIAASSGHPSLDAAALEAVHSWRFSAGRHNGQPVAMRVRVPVRFSIRAGS